MKSILKRLVVAVVYILVAPAGIGSRLLYEKLGSVLAFECFAQVYAQFPSVLGRYTRTAYYHQVLEESSMSVQFAFGSVVTKPQTRIGRGVYVGLYSSIGMCDIGDHTVLANYVSVLSGSRQHNLSDPEKPVLDGADSFTRVRIGRNTFLGDKATVMADVGDACIVGAGAVVTRAIPDYSLAAGVPARVIRSRRPSASEGLGCNDHSAF